MINGKSIGVVVPAYNEERLIERTITTMPSEVDRIVVVNDASRDRTGEILSALQQKDQRVEVLTHEKNQGLGQTLIDGYVRARELKLDVVVVMAGDNQMNPNDLPAVVRPIIEGKADYTKGNRLLRPEVLGRMPKHRFIGNSGLTFLTKLATGYWNVIDPQCGYTAISGHALAAIPIEQMIKGYGYNADILHMLNLRNFRVCDVEVEPVYGEEVSGIKLSSYIPKVSALLARLFFQRMLQKYIIREFHPLVLMYLFSFFTLVCIGVPYFFRFLFVYFSTGQIETTMLIFLLNLLSAGIFALIFGMWLDMEDNRKLSAYPT
ncbi:MAG: glycosyltransferase family 2 protein [Bdellovibrionales bacterium]|nr:glycosyltransferase family 2 protein [Bdellovibrionales bacterium]